MPQKADNKACKKQARNYTFFNLIPLKREIPL